MSNEIKWYIIGGISLVILVICIALIIIFKKKLKVKTIKEYPDLLEALGGIGNISNVSLNGSRVSLNFDNKEFINKDDIKKSGIETIVISNKKITLVVGKNAPIMYKYLLQKMN